MVRRLGLWLLRSVVLVSLSTLVVWVDGCGGSDNQAGAPGTGGRAETTIPSTGGATATTGVGGSGAGGRTGGGTRGTGGALAPGAGGASAGGGGAPADVASQYVDAINAVRSAVTQPAGYVGTWAPLPNVTWSDTVAASAQTWANNLATTNNCGLQHESQNTYGENLAMGTNLTPKQAVDMWAGEKNLYTWSATYSMTDFNGGSGHYTQLVWRKSTQVGCGSATCGRNVVISCRFLSPGNFIGQAAY
jgi:uncharacterized protein YkwD